MMDTLPQTSRAALHDHDHDHHDHGLFGHHHHDHDDLPETPREKARLWLRLGVAGLVLAGAVLAASAIMVGAGQAWW
jgi:ABC-type Zn2+ transport system substrate-binding protein/surface adhesin